MVMESALIWCFSDCKSFMGIGLVGIWGASEGAAARDSFWWMGWLFSGFEDTDILFCCFVLLREFVFVIYSCSFP